MYKSSPDDFMKIAADPNNEAIGFLSHGDNIIIKMRGLPFTATAEDVVSLLNLITYFIPKITLNTKRFLKL